MKDMNYQTVKKILLYQCTYIEQVLYVKQDPPNNSKKVTYLNLFWYFIDVSTINEQN